MAKIDGLEIVMTKQMQKMIDKELKKRFEKLKPELATRYEELLNIRNAEKEENNKLRAELARRDEIITRLKEVLPTLKISHHYCEDCWYSCPKEEDGCCNEAEGEDCNCGADEHNSKIDALMKELEC